MSENESANAPSSPEELYRAFMAKPPADQSPMTASLRLVGLVTVIARELDDVLAYAKTRPDLRRAEFYQRLYEELEQMDDTRDALLAIKCEWMDLGFTTNADRYAMHNQVAELLEHREELWPFAGRPEDHFSTAESYLP